MKLLSRVQRFATPWTVCSLPVFSIHGILQARIREWVAISFSRGFSRSRDQTGFYCFGSQIFLLLSHQERPISCLPIQNKPPNLICNSPFNISHHGDLLYSKELNLDLQSTSATYPKAISLNWSSLRTTPVWGA